jgi:hypothetical protein
MKTLMKTLMGAAGALALAAPASAQMVSPYDLTGMDLNMEACTAEMGLSSMLSSATADNMGDAMMTYATERAALVADGVAEGDITSEASLAAFRAEPQVVWLEFNDANPTFNVFSGGVPFAGGVFPDYKFTGKDKRQIRKRVRQATAGQNIKVVNKEPTQGEYSTIQIGFNDDNPIDLQFGILFGRADNIDFGNDNRSDNAFADASFWQLLAELDFNFGTDNLEFFLGLPPGSADEPDEINAVRQIAVVNQSANTAIHELGHILGLRHHDSFGAPGQGLPPARSPFEFVPVLETDNNALETLDHVMASGASAGLPLANPVLFDRFFSERSSGKLLVNRVREDVAEEDVGPGFPYVELVRRGLLNRLETGINAGAELFLNYSVVVGSIDELGQEDRYVHFLREGQIFNAEIISSSDINNADEIWGKLALSKITGVGTQQPVLLAENQTTFEGREPLLFDYTVPETGFYVLTVSAPDSVPFQGQFVNLSDFGLYEEFGLGDYEVYSYVVEAGGGDDIVLVEIDESEFDAQ